MSRYAELEADILPQIREMAKDVAEDMVEKAGPMSKTPAASLLGAMVVKAMADGMREEFRNHDIMLMIGELTVMLEVARMADEFERRIVESN